MKQVPISQVDVLFAGGLYPIEFIFYYKNPFQTKRLRSALKKLSGPFWPLFGEYNKGALFSRPCREEDHYAESSLDREIDLGLADEKGYAAYSNYQLPDLKTLFFLSVIHLKNGLLVIPKMSHLAGDGYSYFYFLSLLARLSRPGGFPFRSLGTILSFKPHHRRTVLKRFSFSESQWNSVQTDEKITVQSVEISRQEVKSLIREAATADGLRISGNDVLSALSLKKLEEKQAASRGEDADLTIPIDVRRYIKEYGPRFFGNGIWLHTFRLPVADIEKSSLKDLAIRIRKSMPRPSKESYLDYLTGLEKRMAQGQNERLRPFDPERGYLVTNLSNLPADKLDFGCGAPDRVLPLTAERNGAAILADQERYILMLGY
jgi:hypothetical protein